MAKKQFTIEWPDEWGEEWLSPEKLLYCIDWVYTLSDFGDLVKIEEVRNE